MKSITATQLRREDHIKEVAYGKEPALTITFGQKSKPVAELVPVGTWDRIPTEKPEELLRIAQQAENMTPTVSDCHLIAAVLYRLAGSNEEAESAENAARRDERQADAEILRAFAAPLHHATEKGTPR